MLFFIIFYIIFSGLFSTGAIIDSDSWSVSEKIMHTILIIIFIGWWAMPMGLGEYMSKKLEKKIS